MTQKPRRNRNMKKQKQETDTDRKNLIAIETIYQDDITLCTGNGM